jgi:hypothetical protein
MAPKTPGPGRLTARSAPPEWPPIRRVERDPKRLCSRGTFHRKATMPDDLDDVTMPDDLENALEIDDVDGDADELVDELVDDLDDPLAADDDLDEVIVDDLVDDDEGEGEEEGDDDVIDAAEHAAEDADDDDDDEPDEEDVEASLDVILKERLVVVDDEPDDEEATDVEDRSEMSERVLPKQPDEFVCRSCFLVKHPSQLADQDKMLCRDCV